MVAGDLAPPRKGVTLLDLLWGRGLTKGYSSQVGGWTKGKSPHSVHGKVN